MPPSIAVTVDTRSQHLEEAELDAAAAEPGLLWVFCAGEACFVPIPLAATPLLLGRGQGALRECADPKLSRQHASAHYAAGSFHITDLGSRNGSALDGVPLTGQAQTATAQVLRLGQCLFLFCPDLRLLHRFGMTHAKGRVEGALIQKVLLHVIQAAQVSRTLFIQGESGSGKEWVAQTFHRAGPLPEGPFIAVNCAALPAGVAERLLFGAVKGAYSGAVADSEGYLQAAHRGTLFLDEVAELDLGVQAKLLRVIETGMVTPLGATRPRAVELRICCATHRDLRALVGEDKFREDLFFRIGVPRVAVPPLRQRREEIPWLLVLGAQRSGVGLPLHASLVEACLLRPWPGNVRELLAEVNAAAIGARAQTATHIGAEHLSAEAGQALSTAPPAAGSGASEPPAARALRARPPMPSKDEVLAALARSANNASAAARELGLHRTQFRRLLTRYGL